MAVYNGAESGEKARAKRWVRLSSKWHINPHVCRRQAETPQACGRAGVCVRGSRRVQQVRETFFTPALNRTGRSCAVWCRAERRGETPRRTSAKASRVAAGRNVRMAQWRQQWDRQQAGAHA